jgi:hypothetical protein
MDTIMNRGGEYVLALVALLLLVTPIIHYLFTGWAARRKQILAAFKDEGIRYYFCLFYPAEGEIGDDPQAALALFYDKQFGRQHFVLPGVVLLVTSTCMVAFATWACLFWLRPQEESSFNIPAIAVAAIAGAYAWIVHDLVTRAQRGDLHPANLFRASYRFLVAAPLAIGITAFLKDPVGVPFAILLGAFPMRTLMTMARRLASRQAGATDEGKPSHELEKLQGVGRDEAERFEEEGVSTILQLAYADPVALTMKTNFAFSYVVDCCSQALAWLYLEDDLSQLRRFGLRGAQEISSRIGEIDGEDPDVQQQATKCAKAAADTVGADLEVFEWVLRDVAEDPYTRFLCGVWCMEFLT